MPRGKSQTQQIATERASELVRLANEAAAGRFEGLRCPKCHEAAVSVWFTHPAADVYRTWFICAGCDFHSRAQHTDKPPSFTESRVSTDLEERDLLVLRGARFKRPPQRLM